MSAFARTSQLPTDQDEQSLASQARRGDVDAFSTLIGTFSPRLMRVALRLVRNPADAEDVVQAALGSAFRHLASYRGEAPFSCWLKRITIDEAIQLLRRRKIRYVDLTEAMPRSSQTCLWWTSPQQTPEQMYAVEEIQEILGQWLDEMTPTYAVVLRLRIIDELSYDAIADFLHLSVNIVKTRIHRGRRILRTLADGAALGRWRTLPDSKPV